MTKLRIQLAVALCVVVAVVVAGQLRTRVAPPPLAESAAKQEAYWQDRITKEGGERAYAELGEAVAPLLPSKQHEQAHMFGGALYEVEGVKGMGACDANYSYGCYHEFLGRAIAEMGLESVASLNQACIDTVKKSPLSCQHGIGHGIAAFEGYTHQALVQSLKQCKSLPYNDPIGGCYGGVFMEYNFQTMLLSEGRVRPLGSNAYEPCDTVDPDFRNACYYWQPQWWSQASRRLTGPEGFATMGARCAEVGPYIRSCYEGLGNIAGSEADFDPATTKAFCEAVSRDPQYQLYCKSVAANSLSLGGAGKVADGITVCDGLAADDLRYCQAYARNELNQAQPDFKAETQHAIR